MLNGNVGVMESMMAEITDETNIAQGCHLYFKLEPVFDTIYKAFSFVPVVWSIGVMLGYDRST